MMTIKEWLAKTLAAAPPLTEEQVAVLRPIFQPVLQHMKSVPAGKLPPQESREPR